MLDPRPWRPPSWYRSVRRELNCETITPEHVSVAGQQKNESADLWHQRLGHVYGQQLEEIASSGVVKGVHFLDSSLFL